MSERDEMIEKDVDDKRVFVVFHGNHFPREVEGLFATAEGARAYIENGRLSSVMCDLNVEEWEVADD